jgi:hypothetical protein
MTDNDTRLDELTTRVNGLARDIDELTAALMPALDVSEQATPSLLPAFANLEDWVSGFFQPTFRRQFGGEHRWCTRWQEHPEALLRLEALWRSWESLRLDPTLGMATWLTNYADPQLAALTQRTGTFANCTLDRHAY